MLLSSSERKSLTDPTQMIFNRFIAYRLNSKLPANIIFFLIQDAITLSHHLEGSLDGIPDWDQASYEKTRDAVQALADTWPNLDGFNALGWYDDVNPTKVRLKIYYKHI